MAASRKPPRGPRGYPPKRPTGYRPDFARYEAEKRAWIDANPGSLPEDYQAAMQIIAQRCGI